MKKILHYSLISLLSILPIFTTSCSNSVLPTVYLETNGVELPDRSDENYKDYAPSKLIYKDEKNLIQDINGKARIRGTSSRWFPKKGYKIKFSQAVTLPNLSHSKKFNLLASFLDPTLLRDYLALKISYNMNTKSNRYAPNPVLVNLNYDNKDYGLFYLVDDIDIAEDKIKLDPALNTAKEVPFLIEMDTISYTKGEKGTYYFELGSTEVFKDSNGNPMPLSYAIQYPEVTSKEQFNYIESYISSCREALVNKDLNNFSSLVDIDAFIDFFLLGELFRNTDMAGRSVFMYLKSSQDKLILGPSWDFDYTCSRPYQMEPNNDFTLENAKDRFTDYDWWKLFLDIEGSEALIKQRYTSFLRKIYLNEIKNAKKHFKNNQQRIYENANIWYLKNTLDTKKLVDDNYNWTFSYFELRMEMMDNLFLKK